VIREHISAAGLEVLFKRTIACHKVATQKETIAAARNLKVSAYKLPLIYYLARMKPEDQRLFRPGILIPIIEGICTDVKSTAEFKVFLKAQHVKSRGGDIMKSYKFDHIGFSEKCKQKLTSVYFKSVDETRNHLSKGLPKGESPDEALVKSTYDKDVQLRSEAASRIDTVSTMVERDLMIMDEVIDDLIRL
jgi:hypothetical protein